MTGEAHITKLIWEHFSEINSKAFVTVTCTIRLYIYFRTAPSVGFSPLHKKPYNTPQSAGSHLVSINAAYANTSVWCGGVW